MPKGQCYADEFKAGSDAVLDVLEYSAEQLYVRLLDTVSHIPQAAAQVTAFGGVAFVEASAFLSGFVNREGCLISAETLPIKCTSVSLGLCEYHMLLKPV